MKKRWSEKITDYLIVNETVSEEDRELYEFGMMILASPGQHSCNTRTHIPTTFGQAFLYYPDIHS